MRTLFILLYAACIPFMDAAPFVANYDEEKVGTFYLPDSLTMEDGSRVKTADDWKTKRRPEILELYRKHMFGRSPGRPKDLKFEVKSTKADSLDGLATRKEILITVASKPDWKGIMVLLYIPNKGQKPAPAFAGLSFGGNHAVTTEPDVMISICNLRSEIRNRLIACKPFHPS